MAYICQCGCGQEIPPSPLHGKRYEPRFLSGHASRAPETRAKVSASLRRAAARLKANEPEPVYTCQCGCGETIPHKSIHRRRPPRYILGHYQRMGTASRFEKLRSTKYQQRTQPPPGWVAPSGICECGCGEATTISNKTRPERGEYIGYPHRFVFGHRARLLRRERNEQHEGTRTAMKSGYIRLHVPSYPGANRDGWVLEHRYVYETTRGVRLPRGVAVHHLNGIKHDNRAENLIAFTHLEHRRTHQMANALISLFYDDRLLDAAREYVRAHGELPDLEKLTQRVYGQPVE